jgi:PDZ domain-containing protein
VPPKNCPEVADADAGDMRLVMTKTVHDAVEAIEAWADDPDADLPACSDLKQEAAG